MKSEHIEIIKNEIAPLMERGEIALLLGAGFSYKNPSIAATIPGSEELKGILLGSCGKTGGPSTRLKDVYDLASRSLPEYKKILKDIFTVNSIYSWQEKIFSYVWSRIYTTNIDNVLNCAYSRALSKKQVSAEFSFFNYSDPKPVASTIGTIPVITIHGTIAEIEKGFIFSGIEYARVATKMLDWHNDLAGSILVGGVVVIGNQLDESDIDTYIAARINNYGEPTKPARNWIILPNADEIRRENYQASGFHVIDSTAEEFFKVLYDTVQPTNITQTLNLPTVVKGSAALNNARVWFKEAFRPIVLDIESARYELGLLRRYITGSHPEWVYLTNGAHAVTSKIDSLLTVAAGLLQTNSAGVGILHVTGPSGSGKTTAIRHVTWQLTSTYKLIYEYDSINGVDVNMLANVISTMQEKSVFIFYDAYEFYFAINALADRMKDKGRPYVLFILEARNNSFRTNKRQIQNKDDLTTHFTFEGLSVEDAALIAKKLGDHGIAIDGFSNLAIERQANILVNKEKGYDGDLLAALFSLTNHENFETKVYEEFHSVKKDEARRALECVAILHSLGFSVPVDYLAGFLEVRVDTAINYLNEELSGIVIYSHGSVRCRHRLIATYYFDNCIRGHGNTDTVLSMLRFLSRKFNVDDIKYHPIPFRMYKELVSFDFLYEQYYAIDTRETDTEITYHEAQKYYGKDGIFWLHYGRFYRKRGFIDRAIECFRTGLNHFDSFQTRHSLGMALCEKFIADDNAEYALFEEGYQILKDEQSRRGTTDPYPTTTLCEILMRLIKSDKGSTNVRTLLKEHMNYGLKNFKEDDYFNGLLTRYMKEDY